MLYLLLFYHKSGSMSIGYIHNLKYFKNYDIIYVKQKGKGIFIVIGLYPIEKERDLRPAPTIT